MKNFTRRNMRILQILLVLALFVFIVLLFSFPGRTLTTLLAVVLLLLKITLNFWVLSIIATIIYAFLAYCYFESLIHEYASTPDPKAVTATLVTPIIVAAIFTCAIIVACILWLIVIGIVAVVSTLGLWLVGLLFSWL